MPAAGTWPMPAQEPQVGSETVRAGGEEIGEQALARHRLEDAVAAREDDEGDRRMHALAADDARSPPHMSCHEPLVHEPTMTCSIAVPATSLTGTTRSGEPGSATSGSMRAQIELDLLVVLARRGRRRSGRQSASRPRSGEVRARHLVATGRRWW